MAGFLAFVTRHPTRLPMRGWRGAGWLGVVLVILVALPQARALALAGLSGGVVIGAALIIARHKFGSSGPRRGAPIVLFPRTVELT